MQCKWLLLFSIILNSGCKHNNSAPLDDQEFFKYGSVGTEDGGLPLYIFQALPKVFPDHLPNREKGFAAFGMIEEPGKNLPIGISTESFGGIERVGFNCALCHTGKIANAQGSYQIYLGAPGRNVNVQSYLRFLFKVAEDPRFSDGTLAETIHQDQDLNFFQSLFYKYIVIPLTKKGLLKQKERYAWMDTQPDWGTGRIDPLNTVKFGLLAMDQDNTLGFSKNIPLWNIANRRVSNYHVDGLNTSLTEVIHSSALNNGASRTSLNLEATQRIQNLMTSLTPPPYPFPIKQNLAKAGERIFTKHCASCHASQGQRVWEVIPIEEVQTDERRLSLWNKDVAEAYKKFSQDEEWAFKSFIKQKNGYVATTLSGIWARAPYLHNGSVPTIWDLLQPPTKRPQTFYLNAATLDPTHLGITTKPQSGSLLYNTKLPGHSPRGHEWGTALLKQDKMALIEFLKTQ